MADYTIWIDISEGSIGGWIGLSIAIVAFLWVVLVLVKLWITWDNWRDARIDPEPEPTEMDAPPPTLILVDKTEGKVFKQGGE